MKNGIKDEIGYDDYYSYYRPMVKACPKLAEFLTGQEIVDLGKDVAELTIADVSGCCIDFSVKDEE